jgi:hypothetical protein
MRLSKQQARLYIEKYYHEKSAARLYPTLLKKSQPAQCQKTF